MTTKFIALAALLLTGCSQWHWEKPGASRYDLYQDEGKCKSQALSSTPVNAISFAPYAQYGQQAVSQRQKQIFLACMQGKGWMLTSQQPTGTATTQAGVQDENSDTCFRTDESTRQQWLKLREGMSRSDVKKLLGTPLKIGGGYSKNFWYYSVNGVDGPYVMFYALSDKLEGWKGPCLE